MLFSSFGLAEPLLRAIDEKGYSTPTPIQLKAIPAIRSGKDVMAAAQTGTGKTAAFALPLLQRFATTTRAHPNQIRALILAPTRELAVQVAEAIGSYGKHLPVTYGVVYGGVKINPQMMQLRGGVDILVATPGRLLDLYRQNAVKFSQVETLVLDEADRMLDLGFIDDIRSILGLLPGKRQNLLFSATFSSDIRKLADKLLYKPVQIEVNPRNSAAGTVKQWLYEVDKSKKTALFCHLLLHNDWPQVLAFCRTKIGADQLVKQLVGKGIPALAIHGDKSQGSRTHALAEFKANAIRVLVATDIASRGLDISELPYVINVDLPKVAEDYIHRVGRTGRAGQQGVAISLVSADEVKLLSAIETLLGELLVRDVVAGYIPTHSVPLTQLKNPRPKKPKKPKKMRQDQPQAQDESQKSAADKQSFKKNSPRRGENRKTSGTQQEKAGRGRLRKSDDTATTTADRGSSRKNNRTRKR